MFLGVDGGGTKTAFCLVTGDGELVGRRDTGTSYYFAVGLERVAEVLREGIDGVCADADVKPGDMEHGFLGLPGYGEVSTFVDQLDRMPAEVLGHDRYACDNDMVAAWAGSLAGADGVNVIAGTGSMSYGRYGETGARVGGWGEVFGDEGSAYWIGNAALRAFSRMADGRQGSGPLADAVRHELDLATDLDAVDVVLNRWQGDRTRIAALARIVDAVADRDDAAAQILDDAGALLAEHVAVTRARLGWPDDTTMPVSWSGGVFASDRVVASFRRSLEVAGGDSDLRDPVLPPVFGAAVHAARLHGTPLSADAIARLAHSAPLKR